MEKTKMNCPACGAELDVEEVLGHRIEEKYQAQFRNRYAELENGYKQRNAEFAQKEQALKDQQAAIDQQIAVKVAEQTKSELARREREITKQAEEKIKSDYEVRLKVLSESDAESKKQLQELKSAQIENEQLKRKIESQEQDIKLKFEKEHSLKLQEETEVIRKREQERYETELLETKKQLADQKKLAEEMDRKMKQGSQQLQGEVQELLIEEYLRRAFPTDVIEEIGKGKNGADVKQIVRDQFGAEAGIILYESKNTKEFSSSWIEKLKSDAVREKTDVPVLIPVLVTKTMPKNMEHLGLIDRVWVCSITEFKGLVSVLRENLLQVSQALVSQTDKGNKVERLYDYLTSGKLAAQIGRMLDGLRAIREDYQKEKDTIQKMWKKRDIQLEEIWQSTGDFSMRIQMIGGLTIPQLESSKNELLGLENAESQ